jgi:hypothetical protein
MRLNGMPHYRGNRVRVASLSDYREQMSTRRREKAVEISKIAGLPVGSADSLHLMVYERKRLRLAFATSTADIYRMRRIEGTCENAHG